MQREQKLEELLLGIGQKIIVESHPRRDFTDLLEFVTKQAG